MNLSEPPPVIWASSELAPTLQKRLQQALDTPSQGALL